MPKMSPDSFWANTAAQALSHGMPGNIVGIPFHDFQKQFGLKEPVDCEKLLHEVKVSGLDIVELKGYTSSGIASASAVL